MPSANVKIILSNILASDYGGDSDAGGGGDGLVSFQDCALLLGKRDGKDFPVNETRSSLY